MCPWELFYICEISLLAPRIHINQQQQQHTHQANNLINNIVKYKIGKYLIIFMEIPYAYLTLPITALTLNYHPIAITKSLKIPHSFPEKCEEGR